MTVRRFLVALATTTAVAGVVYFAMLTLGTWIGLGVGYVLALLVVPAVVRVWRR